ncbi:MAG: peroxiredoxin family protein [Planctomycetota bacterium]|jgi:tetratricopeptide (TPR) repeat protein
MRRATIVLLACLVPVAWSGRLEPGERAPALRLTSLDGNTEQRYDPPGQGDAPPLVYVVFVTGGQKTSGDALRDIAAVLKAAKDWPRGVRALAIASGKPSDAGAKALQAVLPPDGPILPVLDGDDAAARAFGVIALPTTFVIGPDGRIAAVLPGWSATYRKRLDDASRRALGLEVAKPRRTSREQTRAERLTRLAANLVERRRFREAASQLTMACAAAPKNADLRTRLGEILLLVPDPETAGLWFAEAEKLAPGNQRARRGAAKVAALIGGDLDAIEARIRRELRRPPNDPDLRYYLGRLQERRGRPDLARAAYRRAYEDLRRRWPGRGGR